MRFRCAPHSRISLLPATAPVSPRKSALSNRAIRAIWFSKAVTSVEAAVNWLMDHDTDPGIDEPLLVKKVRGGTGFFGGGGG